MDIISCRGRRRQLQQDRRFWLQQSSAAVFHNASTRLTDGFAFGFGAEIGISTQKLHARDPMGLQALTSYKYVGHALGILSSEQAKEKVRCSERSACFSWEQVQ
jgi:hypothetical protein